MKTRALIEKDENGIYTIFTPDINVAITGKGKTVVEAKNNFTKTVKKKIRSYKENGKKLPVELKGIEFEYRFDVASFFNYYNWINATKFAKTAGINSGLMRQYKAGITYISETQTHKIETALRKLGEELMDIKLWRNV